MKFKSAPPKSWQYQTDAVLNQTNPVSGIQYVVLDTTKNCRIISISIEVTWVGQPSPLEVWVTIDGVSLRFYKNNPASATRYVGVFTNPEGDDQAMQSTPYQKSFVIEGKSIKIEAETTAGATVSNMTCRIKYAVLKP